MRDTMMGDLLFPYDVDGFWEWAALILLWVLTIVFIGLTLWGVLYLIDSTFLDDARAVGVVVGHDFTPAHTQTTFVTVGKVTVPQMHYYPDSWSICIEIEGLTDWVSVSHDTHDRIANGQKLDCIYSNGRIWDSMYVKEFLEK